MCVYIYIYSEYCRAKYSELSIINWFLIHFQPFFVSYNINRKVWQSISMIYVKQLNMIDWQHHCKNSLSLWKNDSEITDVKYGLWNVLLHRLPKKLRLFLKHSSISLWNGIEHFGRKNRLFSLLHMTPTSHTN